MQEKNPPSSEMKRKRLTLILFLAFLAIAAIGLYYLISPYVRQAVRRRAFIFHFHNACEDRTLAPLTYGITREIRDDLVAVRRIVRGYPNVADEYLAFQGIDVADTRLASVGRDVARALGGEYAVVGEINRVGNEIEIKATTINTYTGKRKFHKPAVGPEEEIFRLIDDISVQIARSIGGYLTKKEEARIRRPPTRSLEAFKYFCEGQMADEELRYLDAERAYLQAIALDRDYLSAYVSLAYTCYLLRKYERANKAAQNATEKFPEDAEAWLVLGFVQSQDSEAEKAYLRGLTIDPENIPMLNNIGSIYRRSGDLDKAIEYFDRGLALNSYDPLLNFSKANAFYHNQLYEQAVQHYKAAYDTLPNYENAHKMRGWCLNKLGRYDEALKEFEEELKYYPDDVEALHNVGIAYARKNEWDEAEKFYRKVIRINSRYYRAYYSLGRALTEQGKPSEAVEVYKQGIAINPDYYNFYWALGAVFMEIGRLQESKQCWETYLKYDSTSEQAYWARVRLKQVTAALESKPPRRRNGASAIQQGGAQ
jgi:tetratricopeptide (TPR) repeat protein